MGTRVLLGFLSLAMAHAFAQATLNTFTDSYDASSDQYTYVGKTDQAWANTCRHLVVMFKDGSSHRAIFTLR